MTWRTPAFAFFFPLIKTIYLRHCVLDRVPKDYVNQSFSMRSPQSRKSAPSGMPLRSIAAITVMFINVVGAWQTGHQCEKPVRAWCTKCIWLMASRMTRRWANNLWEERVCRGRRSKSLGPAWTTQWDFHFGK